MFPNLISCIINYQVVHVGHVGHAGHAGTGGTQARRARHLSDSDLNVSCATKNIKL